MHNCGAPFGRGSESADALTVHIQLSEKKLRKDRSKGRFKMDINETTMLNALRPLIKEDEKSLCPVFGMVSKQVKRMTHAASEYAYITITSKGRMIFYRFDGNTSTTESYPLTAIIFGELHKTASTGVYAAELSFIDDNGQQKDVNISIEPQPKGRAFELPNQSKYADKFFNILGKLV
jgi:hypothetical protein